MTATELVAILGWGTAINLVILTVAAVMIAFWIAPDLAMRIALCGPST